MCAKICEDWLETKGRLEVGDRRDCWEHLRWNRCSISSRRVT